MRDLYIAIGIIALVLVSNFGIKGYYDKSGKEIIVMIEELSAGLEIDSEDEKQRKVAELKEKWDSTQDYWIMFQHHEIINAMEDVLLECCNHYIAGDRDEFNVDMDKLKRGIEDLKNREEISVLNIL